MKTVALCPIEACIIKVSLPRVVESLRQIAVNIGQIIGQTSSDRLIPGIKVVRIKNDSIKVERKPAESLLHPAEFFVIHTMPVKIRAVLSGLNCGNMKNESK